MSRLIILVDTDSKIAEVSYREEGPAVTGLHLDWQSGNRWELGVEIDGRQGWDWFDLEGYYRLDPAEALNLIQDKERRASFQRLLDIRSAHE